MAEKKTTKDKKPEVKSPEKPKEAKKSSKGWLFGLIGGIALVGIIIAGFFLLRPGAAPDDPKAKLSYSNSFFIYDNSQYTLWNAEGKRLTEDTYESKSDFIAGYALVKKDGQYAIIRDDGVITVPFGKYGSIEAQGSLFLAQDGNTKEYHVLTGAGKDLMKGPEISLESTGSANAFALVKSTGMYDLFTFSGAHLGTFLKNDDDEDAKLAANSDFGLFYFNNLNLLFDVRNGQVLASFEGSRYTFDSVNDARTMILLENENDDEGGYKLVAGGRIIDLNETKYYGMTALDHVIGYDDYNAISLLDNNYKVVKTVSSYVALKDTNNYATVSEDKEKAEIYQNGNLVATIEGDPYVESGVLYENFYAIKSNDKFRLYNLDGSLALNGREFADVWSLFNKHHHAIVADAEDEYYLMDAKGTRLTEGTYKRIYTEEGGYELKASDGKYAIADKTGKVVSEAKYDSVYYRSSAVDHDIWTGKNANNDYDVYDLTAGKILLEHVNVGSFYANYFTVKNADDKYEYYTYTGQIFYTSES